MKFNQEPQEGEEQYEVTCKAVLAISLPATSEAEARAMALKEFTDYLEFINSVPYGPYVSCTLKTFKVVKE